jgi:hypothetical protein
MKFFVSLLSLLIVSSLVFPATVVVADQDSQEKTMEFMEQVLPIDLSKYYIVLKIDSTREGTPPLFDDNRKVTDMLYELRSENSVVHVSFSVENGVIPYCNIYPMEGQVITSKRYTNLRDAVVGSLSAYQAYIKTDLNNLVATLNGVNFAKNSTIITENAKLTITTTLGGGINYIHFDWVRVINGVEYPYLSFRFDRATNVLLGVNARGAMYTVGDTSVNISEEQAVAIAVENIRTYSYELADGSVVGDFDVSDYGWIAELAVSPVDYVDYELRPYWDVRIFLGDISAGNVFAFSVLIWANTGEVISIGNMATGGTFNVEDIKYSNADSASDGSSSSDNIVD